MVTGKYLSPLSISYISIAILAFLSTIFLAICLKANIELKMKILTLIISVGITIIGYELYLSIPPENLDNRINLAKNAGIEFDTRTMPEVLNDLNQDISNPIYPSFHPSLLLQSPTNRNGLNTTENYKLFPLSNIANITSIFTNENGYYPIVKTDKYGFTNSDNNYTKKEIDIILIGDSYVEGYSVHQKENIASLLNNKGFKTLSLGKGGTGPVIQFATLREYGKLFKPNIVIWFYVAGDQIQLYNELNSNILINYINDPDFTQNLSDKQLLIDQTIKEYINSIILSENLSEMTWESADTNIVDGLIRIAKLTEIRNLYLRLIVNLSNDKNIQLKKILGMSNDIVNEWNGELYVVYLPNLHELSKTEIQLMNQVYSISNQLNIKIIDFHDTIYNTKNHKSYYPLGLAGHYNSEGYKLLADNIIEKIK